MVAGMVDGRPVVVFGMEDGAGCGCRDGRWYASCGCWDGG